MEVISKQKLTCTGTTGSLIEELLTKKLILLLTLRNLNRNN